MLILLAPAAPHIAEELWKKLGNSFIIHQQPRPQWVDSLIAEDTCTVPVQVNGKSRGVIQLKLTSRKVDAMEEAMKHPDINNVVGTDLIRSVYVPGKILNIVTKQ